METPPVRLEPYALHELPSTTRLHGEGRLWRGALPSLRPLLGDSDGWKP